MTPDNKEKSFQQRREELLKSRLVKDTCPECGNTNIPPGSTFCNECGAPLGERVPREDTNTSSTQSKHAGEAIDLGLPSGTKWASCNVGATKPEEYGSYFAWGETEEKEYYDWETYIHCDGDEGSCHNLFSDIAGTKYDVAHVKWGGNWRMPTNEQIEELLDNCTKKWTKINGIEGRKFTSKLNGNSIFLPAAGDRWLGVLFDVGSRGYYWSSSQDPSYSYYAYSLDFGSGNASWDGSGRGLGFPVRPVSR